MGSAMVARWGRQCHACAPPTIARCAKHRAEKTPVVRTHVVTVKRVAKGNDLIPFERKYDKALPPYFLSKGIKEEPETSWRLSPNILSTVFDHTEWDQLFAPPRRTRSVQVRK